MKISIILLLMGVLATCCRGQSLEPFGDMARPTALLYQQGMASLEVAVVAHAGQLQGVQLGEKTGKPKIDKAPWRPDFPKGSWMADNVAKMDMESIVIAWVPPKPPSLKASEGGSNVEPRRSLIWIIVGCLKGDASSCVVYIERSWTYNIRTHVPYTEIPLWRTDRTMTGSYPSDVAWLRQLAPGATALEEYHCVEYDTRILEALKKLSEGGGSDNKRGAAAGLQAKPTG